MVISTKCFLKGIKKEEGDLVTEDRFKQGTVSELIEVTVSYKDVLKENKVFAIKSPYLKGVTFEDVASEFYEGRNSSQPTSLDDMLYTDALDMVTFLNSK